MHTRSGRRFHFYCGLSLEFWSWKILPLKYYARSQLNLRRLALGLGLGLCLGLGLGSVFTFKRPDHFCRRANFTVTGPLGQPDTCGQLTRIARAVSDACRASDTVRTRTALESATRPMVRFLQKVRRFLGIPRKRSAFCRKRRFLKSAEHNYIYIYLTLAHNNYYKSRIMQDYYYISIELTKVCPK